MQLNIQALAVSLLAGFLLAACGGGDSSTTAAATAATTNTTASTTSTASTPPAGCTTLTYSTTGTNATANQPHASGDKVCFLATTTQLDFSGKSLTNPTQNTRVTAPNSAYAFTDGSYKYEVVFRSGVLHEINVNNANNSVFYGQFAP